MLFALSGSQLIGAQASTPLVCTGADGVTYHTTSHARNNQIDYAGRIRSQASEIIGVENDMDAARQTVSRLQSEVRTLQAQKARDMDEYRNGQYCTACD